VPASSVCCCLVGAERAEPAHADVFFVFEEGADRARVLPLLAELRRRGLRADMDYAGRSVKGQLTQAGRLGAGWTVIVNGGQATVRESAVPTSRRRSTSSWTGSPDEHLARPVCREVRPDHVGQELTAGRLGCP